MSTLPANGGPLPWGRDYLMVEPNHFRVDYAINPFMDLNDQPEPLHTRAEWLAVVAAIEAAGGRVQVLPQLPDAPDMVYAMNLGLALETGPGDVDRQVVLSHMRFAQRRMETPAADDWFAANGFTSRAIGRDGVGAHFEAGDAFAWRGELLVGYGPRTEELALKHLATDLGVRVRGFRITHPGMYHMDLGFCPLDDTRAMVCPGCLRRRLRGGAPRPRARAAGAHRGRGDDLLRELDRDRSHHRDARLSRAASADSWRSGASRSSSSRSASSSRVAARSGA